MKSVNQLQVGRVTFGGTQPAICVPLTGTSTEALMLQVREAAQLSCDVVEWRGDFYTDIRDEEIVFKTLSKIRPILSDKLLLFTLRSHREGGHTVLSDEEYLKIIQAVIKTELAELIDVELFIREDVLDSLLKAAKAKGIKVILSNHDFHQTPPEEEIIRRLKMMQEKGADLCKIAVMPTCRQDVLTLMSATLAMWEQFAKKPLIAMSMGELGKITRITGSFFGSSMTFGSLNEASAPGQIPFADLKEQLMYFHK